MYLTYSSTVPSAHLSMSTLNLTLLYNYDPHILVTAFYKTTRVINRKNSQKHGTNQRTTAVLFNSVR